MALDLIPVRTAHFLRVNRETAINRKFTGHNDIVLNLNSLRFVANANDKRI